MGTAPLGKTGVASRSRKDLRGESARLRAFAVAPPGFEALVGAELRGLGLESSTAAGGVEFIGSWRDVQRANLQCRVASRILVRVAEFGAETFRALQAGLRETDWAPWLAPRSAVRLKVAKHRTRLYHTGKVAEAASEVLEERLGLRRAEEREAAASALYLRIDGSRVTVSLDTSGEHLHKRGYRNHVGVAPIRENVAAGLLLSAAWDGSEPLLDPFCGSGTLSIEAALLALGVPPGWRRNFAFQRMPAFNPGLWAEVREEAGLGIRRELPVPVYASDRDAEALRLAARAARLAGLEDRVLVAVSGVEELEAPEGSGCVITNPPYGHRLDERGAYRQLGRVLRGRFSRWRWAVVTPGQDREREMGLTIRTRHLFRSGGLRLSLVEGGPEAP